LSEKREPSSIEIPEPRIVEANLRSAKNRGSTQLCPSCSRPNKVEPVSISLRGKTEAIAGFLVLTAQECVYCGHQMYAVLQSCRPKQRESLRHALQVALSSDDTIIPWEGPDDAEA
jgi:hypothetical protein